MPMAAQVAAPAVLKCYENLFRDWAWGGEECASFLSLVERLVVEPLGRLAVYGAGAARLAVDVHRRFDHELTLAIDLNPFPLLIADALLRGERVTLPEFPVAPLSDRDVVVERELAARRAGSVGPSPLVR